ncbi:bifunctional salicylyl-CoA 5-hydroxylase/oxidoreductase [Ktedonosporobacter rubrisoli]|uniref:Bifunctional salicylyl-CoA 5-hydroxylase/oxidoreductase n=1 Tax=Ktedonosporobacter rubrisoli TaxID=2509675 RepID=A0A4P6JRK6_KTERU|nr:FAD-dependent monooxygenase [Ktedonosporobacter rubrisoli]QBD77840.1 bifunctional salicylyl-CoA 5-hydroxylase/oxidoreductase [Ktedonosporobacter rubrisoli]
MKIVILGAGPAGLYCGLLIKKVNPDHEITIIERNPADITYGWGVVFSDRTLAAFQRADYKTFEQIRDRFVIWDAIDVRYRNETIRCGGHVIASIARKLLLGILQRRCQELGVRLQFNREIHELSDLPEHDLLIAADGINSLVRKTYPEIFRPQITPGKARYIWLGAHKVLDAFTFIFRENADGLFQVHAYPFSGDTSTFIIECDESSWLNAGLDQASEQESLAYCERLLAADLQGAPLLSNNSKWINFPTLKTRTWHHQRIVLLGDAVHTAHFSIGSGTKLAMEDAITLAGAIEQYADLQTALNAYELERKPVVEIFQNAAQESQAYFETLKRYLGLAPMQFTFQLLTRSGRISYDDLKFRDPNFGDAVDRWYTREAAAQVQAVPQSASIFAPPPMFTPLKLRELTLASRIAIAPAEEAHADQGLVDASYTARFASYANGGASLLVTDTVAVSAEGRITPADAGIYRDEHVKAWARCAEYIHKHTSAKLAILLNHAGRRGSTRPRSAGLDRPLRQDNWPLLSASALPYTSQSQIPREMERADMDHVRDEFVRAAQLAQEAGFDLLQLHFAHGYLLASFLSPLSNRRSDEYGGDLAQRMRFPLEVFDAVRACWPAEKPLAVALTASDCVKGGNDIEEAVVIASTLKEHGCDMIVVLAGQTTVESEPAYGRGFLTSFSDHIRNRARIATVVGGYLTTSNEVNTILAAGRADLCMIEPSKPDQDVPELQQLAQISKALQPEIVKRG